MELSQEANRHQRLAAALQPVQSDFDFILIDCPPSLDILTVNALIAADSVLIPIQCEYFALEGRLGADGDDSRDPHRRPILAWRSKVFC